MSIKGQVFVFSGAKKLMLGTSKDRTISILERSGYKVHYLEDTGGQFFIDPSFIDEKTGETIRSPSSTSKYIAKHIGDHPINIAFAASAGGFSAIRTAIENDFTAVVGHSAFTTFDNELDYNDPRAERRGGAKIYSRTQALEPDNKKRNIKYYLDKYDYAGKIHLYYPSQNPGDTYHAMNLADYDCVTLHPQNAASHTFYQEAGMSFRQCWEEFDISLTEQFQQEVDEDDEGLKA